MHHLIFCRERTGGGGDALGVMTSSEPVVLTTRSGLLLVTVAVSACCSVQSQVNTRCLAGTSTTTAAATLDTPARLSSQQAGD